MSRNASLDGLRGIAIILILIYHFVIPLLSHRPATLGGYLTVALSLSYTGVDLFFVLSGFLICSHFLERETSAATISHFLFRRMIRIFPLLFLALVALLAADIFRLYREAPRGGAPWGWPIYLFFSSNIKASAGNDWGYRPLSHFWTVALEGQFYLIAAFLFWQIPRALLGISLTLFALVGPLVRCVLWCAGFSHLLAATVLPFGRFDSLGAGMLVAWAMHSPVRQNWLARNQTGLGIAAGASLVICVWLSHIHAGNASAPMVAGGYSACAVIYAVGLIRILVFRDGSVARFLQHRLLVFLGGTAYFLYLFQGLIIGLAVGVLFYRQWVIVLPETAFQLLVGLIVLCLVGWASRNYLERPLYRWARQIGNK